MLLSRYQIQVKDYPLHKLPRLNFIYVGEVYQDDIVLIIRNTNDIISPLVTMNYVQDFAILQQLTIEQYTVLRLLPTIKSICEYLESLKE